MDDHLVPRREVIVGGGFAGHFAASEPWHRRVEVTVVDRAAAGLQQSYSGHTEFAPHACGRTTLADALVLG